MSQRCYQCTKCRITVTKDSFPSTSGCINGTTHHWHELGEVGNSNFSCNKCGTLVQTKSFPDSAGCLNGTTHSWHKL
jgi:hypothetical protein